MNRQSRWINLKNLIILFVILAILIAVTFILIAFVYLDHSKVDNQDAVIKFVKEASEIDKVTGLDYFADEEIYDIVYGKDANDEAYFAINPVDNRDKDQLTVIKQADVHSKESIEQNWQSDCDACTLEKSGPAMLDDEVLWELTYFDQAEKYVIEYFSLEDGATYEKFRIDTKY